MIDTDKYEGHTEGSWEGILSGYFTIEQLDKTDKVLMQDAPLLLQEVKRLREQYTELREALVGDSPNWTHEELIEKALEMIDNE